MEMARGLPEALGCPAETAPLAPELAERRLSGVEPTARQRVFAAGHGEKNMRLVLGIILGGFLTVGAAYLYDSHNAAVAIETPASAPRPLVNWDVVSVKWQHLAERARSEWNRHAG
jgi:hypothetical protein